MHPYEVAHTLRARAKHEAVRLNYGSLYTVVEGLQKRGLIEARETVREGRRPERTVYAITDAGTAEMTDWLADLVRTPEKEYLRFEAALSFIGALPPDEALELLVARADALELVLARHRASMTQVAAMGVPRVYLLETEYVIRLTETELAWVRDVADDLTAGRLDGADEWRAFHAAGEEPTT
jgi:DNA-binding PadR family transcriptional regulator